MSLSKISRGEKGEAYINPDSGCKTCQEHMVDGVIVICLQINTTEQTFIMEYILTGSRYTNKKFTTSMTCKLQSKHGTS